MRFVAVNTAGIIGGRNLLICYNLPLPSNRSPGFFMEQVEPCVHSEIGLGDATPFQWCRRLYVV